MLNYTNKTDITGIMLDNINIFLSGLSLNNFSYNLIEHIENIVEIEVIHDIFLIYLHAWLG